MSERLREIAELLAASGIGAAGVGGLWAWLSRRPTGKAEVRTSEAAILTAATRLQEVMNEAVEQTVTDLRSQLQAVREEARTLRERVEHLEGENRAIRQHGESLEALLRRQGIEIPEALSSGALLVVEDGRATVSRTRRKGGQQ